MRCPKCGKTIEDISIVCSYCGEQVSTYTSTNNASDYKREKQPSGMLGPFLFIVSLALMIPTFFINTVGVLSIGGVSAFSAGVVLFAVSRYFKYRNVSKHPTDKVAKSIAKRLAHENNETVRLIAKKVPIARTILTLCFAVLLYFVLDLLYYQYWVIPVLAVLFLVYEALFFKINTFTVLYKKAQKSPDLTAADIILEETYNEVDSPQIVKTALICVAVIAIAIGGFIYLNLESNLAVENVENGVSISKYEPGLLHLQDSVDIPSEIEGKQVVAVSEDAFAWNIYVKSISMPDTVKTIGKSAFYDCRSLTNIKMSPIITEIEDEAFANCYSLNEIDVPSTLVKMGKSIFENCNSLRSVNVPEGVTIIPEGAFDGCSSLETVDWHEGITEIQAYAFRDCDTISEAGFPEGIKEIADHLFDDCDNLQTVYIPNGVKRIGKYAFNGCKSLSYVFVPDTVTEIGKYAFDDCESLNQISLPKDVSIHEDAFDEEVTTIKEKTFTDETTAKIDQEFSDFTIEKIYVVYDKDSGKDVVYSPRNDSSITVSHSERFTENLADNMDLFVIETPVEFKEYLKKARDAGMVNVLMAFDSQVAAEAVGEPYFVSYNFDVEALIQSYEENPNEF